MLCRYTSRGTHSRRLACLRSHLLRAYCNFESSLRGRRSKGKGKGTRALARPNSPFTQATLNQNRRSRLLYLGDAQIIQIKTSFRGETSGGVEKCRPFSQTTMIGSE